MNLSDRKPILQSPIEMIKCERPPHCLGQTESNVAAGYTSSFGTGSVSRSLSGSLTQELKGVVAAEDGIRHALSKAVAGCMIVPLLMTGIEL